MPPSTKKPRTQPRTQEQRRDESEKQMLKAAIRLFARQGYTRTTLTDVGKESGYTAGLVSHRFGSKEGLLRAVVRDISRRFTLGKLGTSLERTNATESIATIINLYLSEASLGEGPVRAIYVIMGEAIGAMPEIGNAIAKLNTSARDNLTKIIHQGIEDKEFRSDLDANAAATMIIGTLRGLVMQYLIDPGEVNLAKIKPTVVAASIGGLR